MRMLISARYILVLAILFAVPTIVPAPSFAQIGVSITIAPPAIPVYTQPECPQDGFLWTPGDRAYGPEGYYWVPGVWIAPPRVGLLWTPGYWGFAGGFYGWHGGYWGPHVGFYGGINYGFGYGGVGFFGGRWDGGHFAYNTAVFNVNRTYIHNTYEDRTVIRENNVHTSFNGPGGVNYHANSDERAAMHEEHVQRTSEQISHQQTASHDRSQFASENHGHPGNPAMGRVNERSNNQQQRIANGVHSGQMTPSETAHAEHNEANINHEVHNDRAANGGHLTPQEHQQVNHQQNQESRQIYNQKHNDRTDSHPHPAQHSAPQHSAPPHSAAQHSAPPQHEENKEHH